MKRHERKHDQKTPHEAGPSVAHRDVAQAQQVHQPQLVVAEEERQITLAAGWQSETARRAEQRDLLEIAYGTALISKADYEAGIQEVDSLPAVDLVEEARMSVIARAAWEEVGRRLMASLAAQQGVIDVDAHNAHVIEQGGLHWHSVAYDRGEDGMLIPIELYAG